MADRLHDRSAEFRVEQSSDGLTIEGYAAVFDQPSDIDDWAGSYRETIKRGAFRDTLAARGPAKVKMQWNHGHDPGYGQMPVGVWQEMHEDRHGLFVRGKLIDAPETIRLRACIQAGAVDGMSFRFAVPKGGDKWNQDRTEREIRTLALFEAGPVGFPAYEGTSVGLRAVDQALIEVYRSMLLGIDVDPDMLRAAVHAQSGPSAIVTATDTAVAPVGDTDPATRTVADPPVGITRRELRRIALPVLLGDPNVEASGDAA